MSVAFWSVELKAGVQTEVQPPEGYVLNIQQAALAVDVAGPVRLKVITESIEGAPIDAVLCTLRQSINDQSALQLVFGYDVSVKLYITGDSKAIVNLSGYYQPAPEDFDEDDEDGEDEDDEDDDEDDEDEDPVKLKALVKSGKSKDQDVVTAKFIKVHSHL